MRRLDRNNYKVRVSNIKVKKKIPQTTNFYSELDLDTEC